LWLIEYLYCFQAILQGARQRTDGVDKLKVLIEVVLCFELIRDKTMSLLLVKFQQRALGASQLSFWSQMVDV
jgi:hypothetical protein